MLAVFWLPTVRLCLPEICAIIEHVMFIPSNSVSLRQLVMQRTLWAQDHRKRQIKSHVHRIYCRNHTIPLLLDMRWLLKHAI